MSSLHPARRRAERFDDAVAGAGPATGLDPELVRLVELVGALRETPQPAARPAFVSDLRSSLLAAAETELVPVAAVPAAPARTSTPTTPRPRRERRLAVALGGLALVGATTSMAVAAQSALPGDVLYPVKRVIEDADTSLTAGDHRGTELLDHATGRLDELDQLGSTRWDGARTEAAEDALATFGDQATEASDLLIADYEASGSEASITELRDFTGQSIDQLSALEAVLPADLRPALVSAAQVLVGIDEQAADLCPGCGTGILDLPGTLVSAVLPLEEPGDGDDLTTADAEEPSGQLVAPSTPPRAKPTPKATPPVLPVLPSTPPLTEVPPVVPTTPSGAVPTKPGTQGTKKKKVTDPIKGVTGLVDGVVDGLTGSTATPAVPLPSVGAVLDGVLGTVGGLTGPLLGPPKK